MEDLVRAHEGQGEDEAHNPPDVGVVGLPAVVVAAASHLPGDLVPGPHVRWLQGLVVYPNLGDRLLAGVLIAQPAQLTPLLDLEVDLPYPVIKVGIGGGLRAVFGELLTHLRVGRSNLYRAHCFGRGEDLYLYVLWFTPIVCHPDLGNLRP